MRIRVLTLAAILAAVSVLALPAQDTKKRPTVAGPTPDGFLLPNGWKLRPAGEHLVLTDLPLNIAPLANGKHALVATSGFNKHRLSLVDLRTRKVLHSQEVHQSYFGLAVSPDERRVWWAGGGANLIHAYALADGTLTRTSKPEPKPAKKALSK